MSANEERLNDHLSFVSFFFEDNLRGLDVFIHVVMFAMCLSTQGW
jgi:hypothetical protein